MTECQTVPGVSSRPRLGRENLVSESVPRPQLDGQKMNHGIHGIHGRKNEETVRTDESCWPFSTSKLQLIRPFRAIWEFDFTPSCSVYSVYSVVHSLPGVPISPLRNQPPIVRATVVNFLSVQSPTFGTQAPVTGHIVNPCDHTIGRTRTFTHVRTEAWADW